MAKLYPPVISGIIPAFAGTTLVVPFSMNRAVSRTEVGGYSLKLKTINNLNKLTSDSDMSMVLDDNQVMFTIDPEQLKTANGKPGYGHYKIQLAYKDKSGEIGFYSTVGVVKYTATPTVKINDLKTGVTNSHIYDYTMTYTNIGDPTEKMYNYRFVVTKVDGTVIEDTGYQLHNTSNDSSAAQATELFHLNRDIPFGEIYCIQGFGTTSNNYEFRTPKYKLVQKKSINPDVKFDLTAELDYDNGVVNIGVANCDRETLSGLYLLSRCDVADQYNWEELKRLDLRSVKVDEFKITDFTPMQGVTYQYSLQQYNDNGVYSERIKTEPIYVDFEDMFLFDGERQLCVRFNPKVATYKRDLQENKVETIGSKYPYIMRNGNVNYKEFSIAGLISYQMDGDNFYMDVTPTLDPTEFRTDLVGANFAAERTFKNDILDWLNDGKVKLFRSPAEGNYIVRLMNVSMSPNDSLGRMLHSFTCTAYELDEVTNTTLQKYGIVDSSEAVRLATLFASVDIGKLGTSGWTSVLPEGRIADSVFFVDMQPGTKVQLFVVGADAPETIMIGITGSYRFNSDNGIRAVRVYMEGDSTTGIFTYSYAAKPDAFFGQIADFSNEEVPIHQFIGTAWQEPRTKYTATKIEVAGTYTEGSYENEDKEVTANAGDIIVTENNYIPDNVLDVISNDFRKVPGISYLKATRRKCKPLYLPYDADVSEDNLRNMIQYYSGGLFWDMNCTEPVRLLRDLEEIYLYELRLQFLGSDLRGKYYENGQLDYSAFPNAFYYIDANINKFSPAIGYYLDGCDHYNNVRAAAEATPPAPFMFVSLTLPHDLIKDDGHVFSMDLDGENIDLTETHKYQIVNHEFKTIIPHAGVIVEIGYTAQKVEYLLDDETLKKRLGIYTNNQRAYEQISTQKSSFVTIYGLDYSTKQVQTMNTNDPTLVRLQLEYTYKQYIEALSCALATWNKEQGNADS